MKAGPWEVARTPPALRQGRLRMWTCFPVPDSDVDVSGGRAGLKAFLDLSKSPWRWSWDPTVNIFVEESAGKSGLRRE